MAVRGMITGLTVQDMLAVESHLLGVTRPRPFLHFVKHLHKLFNT